MSIQLELVTLEAFVDMHEPEAFATGYVIFRWGDGTVEVMTGSRRMILVVKALLDAEAAVARSAQQSDWLFSQEEERNAEK